MSGIPDRQIDIGPYRLDVCLGIGGMGEVYRATDIRTGRLVAIKRLLRTIDDPRSIERFHNEATILAALHHPNIAALYATFSDGGRPCIVMEYIEGPTLYDRLRKSGPLPLPEALAVLRAVVEAIVYIHEQGIIHRDIKTNNVKVTPDGRVKLLDFGIARTAETPHLTEDGSVIGTIQYLSPEQILGAKVDTRSDIWALGVMFHEMVTGRLPFEGDNLGEISKKILQGSYRGPEGASVPLPPIADEILTRCLKRRATQRYQSARELLDDIHAKEYQCLEQKTAAPRSSRFLRSLPLVGLPRSRQGRFGAGAVALLLLGALALGLWPRTGMRPSGQTETWTRQPVASTLGAITPTPTYDKQVRFSFSGGDATFLKDGKVLSTERDFTFTAKPGDTVSLTVRRDHSPDVTITHTVSAGDRADDWGVRADDLDNGDTTGKAGQN